MIEVKLLDFLKVYKSKIGIGNNNKLVNLRGTNGSGKSSVPFSFINSDEKAFELTYEINGKNKVLATVCPTYSWLFLGSYRTKCGGLDAFGGNEQTADTLKMVWELPFNILMEGVISSTIYSTYSNLFKNLNSDNSRRVIIATLLPPVEICLKRIQLRNGGKPINEELVKGKYETMLRNHEKFLADGFECLKLDNSAIKLEETREWFLSSLGMNSKVDIEFTKSKENTSKTQDLEGSGNEELIIPDIESIKHYSWFKYYKQPNSKVKVNWENMRLYWYWIAERTNIWYERVINKKPAPWTSDKILQENSFTNAIRDLDKGTILYINNILKKIDEPVEDLVKRKKEIILNTLIYRLFIKKETMDAIGWFFELDKWDEQWARAKYLLRSIKKSGESVFHGAYYVNDLHAASPSPDNHDKTENAINLIENFWYPKVDEIYDFITTHDMKDTLDYLTTLCCVGRFTAYEYCCDWAMCSRHTINKIVDWDDDSYVNIGPGNKKGLDFVFIESGNLSDIEKDIYLRATWREYMKRYGFYDKFMTQLPDWMNGDINLRVIEHDMCETQKYLNVYYGTGKCKKKFGNNSKPEDLVL